MVPTTSDSSTNTKLWHILFHTQFSKQLSSANSHFPLNSFSSHSKSSFHTFLFHDLNLRSLLLQTPLCCILVLTIIFSLLHELCPLPKIDRSHQASRTDLTNPVQWSHHCSIQKFIENFKILCWVLNQKEVRCLPCPQRVHSLEKERSIQTAVIQEKT